MHHHYADIRERIRADPRWWDEAGVPRYSRFHPTQTANIYAQECCLLLITCQGCGTEFQVALSQSHMGQYQDAELSLRADRICEPSSEQLDQAMQEAKLSHATRLGLIHYGDPPNVGCCPAGATMNSIPVRVMEFWVLEAGRWERKTELEIDLRGDGNV